MNWFCFFFRFEVEEEEEDRVASLVVMTDDIFAFRAQRSA